MQTTLPSGRLRSVLYGICLTASVLACFLGLLVLFGWHTGNRTLTQILPDFAPMQYNTALGFVASGIALGLLTVGRRNGAVFAGCLALLIGGLTLVEYIADVNLGIDELFMKHEVTVKTSQPGRMAPNTALCFTLIGLVAAFELLHWPASRKSLLKVILGSTAFGLSAVALSGYLTDLETAYGWGNLTRMALHTSAGFMVVSIGLLCLAWSRDIREPLWLPRWMPALMGVAIMTITVCFWQALHAEGARVRKLYQDLSSLPNLAAVLLVIGILLAVAMALAAYMAQKARLRTREIARTNRALQREVATRRAAEAALQMHRDNLETLVTERTRELDLARREAESANRAKSDFLSHMSHELRTPLNGILGYAQILQRDRECSRQQRGNVQSIVDCGDHLLALINDVLDLSKIEAGRLDIDTAPIDLNKLVQNVGDIVRQRATRKGLDFQVEVGPDLPAGIITDGAKLRQILVNLLGNAVKFTSHGGIRLRVAQVPAGSLMFQVFDTGVGMGPDEIEEIFDPFKQVEAGKAAGGTGLGLAITQRLTEALGGVIQVESRKGAGSTFAVTLPMQESSSEDLLALNVAAASDAENRVLAGDREWTILVVDDRDTNRDVLDGMLSAAGFRTILASDGVEAIETLRREKAIDLVLMDIRMPRMDGNEALAQIRQDEWLKAMKVIAVTASALPRFQKKAIEAGFDDFLGKPFRVSELLDKLARHLDVEFVTVPSEMGDDVSEHVLESVDPLGPVPAELIGRLHDALKIKNLTALKVIAAELSSDATTAAAGEQIATLIRSFDFHGLAALMDTWQQNRR